MYIEYTTPQQVADSNITKYSSKGGEYRPTWLIRASDWQKVPGHEATDGYHTLSYCWEQSGEKFLQADGEYGLTDDGHHRIVETKKARLSSSNLFRYRPYVPAATNEVTYDKLLQRICKDFDIEYLWYDKICIDQTNKEDKKREIKQMHLIYSNARYTVALVPEIYIDDPKDFKRVSWALGYTEAKAKALGQMKKSLWFRRSWTLEELMMSTQILILGRNTHFWSLADIKQGDKIKEDDFLANVMLGFKERKTKSVNQVLHHAHRRTSTKEHDKTFALANIFHYIIDIDIDYSINVSIAMKTFYRRLAEKDLSLMCFGSNLYPSGDPVYVTTMDSYNLPSWTGVTGIHSDGIISSITLDQNYDYTIDGNMGLHIKCRSYTIRPAKYNDNGLYHNDKQKKKANENYFRVIASTDDFDDDESMILNWSQWCMAQTTNCFSNHYYKPDNQAPFVSPLLPLSLTEECDECVILGVVFNSLQEVLVNNVCAGYGHDYLAPIARMSTDDSSYRVIGVILLKHFQHDEPRPTPQEVMDRMFDNLGCETRDFCIE